MMSVAVAPVRPVASVLPGIKSNRVRPEEAVRCSFDYVQRNGQRIYGGPPPQWTGPLPGKGCEVYVTKIPRDCFEDELVPIFEKVGPVYEHRLMMEFTGNNRGYGYVRFGSATDAKDAIRKLNNYEVRPNRFLVVTKSVDNRRLWVNGIPKNRSANEIRGEMEKMTAGVTDIILYPSQADKTKSRGYMFVEYESHRAAALARRKLVPGKAFLFGVELGQVDWAEPEHEVDEETMKTAPDLLQEICQNNHWGDPIYQIQTSAEDTTGEMCYLYKVTIPNFPVPAPNNLFQSCNWKPTKDDAKIEAAQFILACLRITPDYVAAVMKPPQETAMVSPVYPVSPMLGVPLTAGWSGLNYPPPTFYQRVAYTEPYNYASMVASMYGITIG